MTKEGIKTEDYRELTGYWYSILCTYQGRKNKREFWKYFAKNNMDHTKVSFVNFDYNIMTLGYPKSGDKERILKLEHKGIEIRTGREEWGAEPNKLYFVIKHGEIIE